MAKKWYVSHTYSGYEAKVRDALQQRAKQFALEEKFGEILIPSETVTDNARAARRACARSSASPATSSSRWR